MSVPYTIQTIIEQLGGNGLRGGLIYVGASDKTYKCHSGDGECRAGYRSKVTPEGLLDYDVGLAFSVNGRRGQGWKMVVAYEPDDTYTVWLWRRAKPTERAAGVMGVVLDTRDDVYCDVLQETVERMYDNAIKAHNQGFIPC